MYSRGFMPESYSVHLLLSYATQQKSPEACEQEITRVQTKLPGLSAIWKSAKDDSAQIATREAFRRAEKELSDLHIANDFLRWHHTHHPENKIDLMALVQWAQSADCRLADKEYIIRLNDAFQKIPTEKAKFDAALQYESKPKNIIAIAGTLTEPEEMAGFLLCLLEKEVDEADRVTAADIIKSNMLDHYFAINCIGEDVLAEVEILHDILQYFSETNPKIKALLEIAIKTPAKIAGQTNVLHNMTMPNYPGQLVSTNLFGQHFPHKEKLELPEKYVANTPELALPILKLTATDENFKAIIQICTLRQVLIDLHTFTPIHEKLLTLKLELAYPNNSNAVLDEVEQVISQSKLMDSHYHHLMTAVLQIIQSKQMTSIFDTHINCLKKLFDNGYGPYPILEEVMRDAYQADPKKLLKNIERIITEDLINYESALSLLKFLSNVIMSRQMNKESLIEHPFYILSLKKCSQEQHDAKQKIIHQMMSQDTHSINALLLLSNCDAFASPKQKLDIETYLFKQTLKLNLRDTLSSERLIMEIRNYGSIETLCKDKMSALENELRNAFDPNNYDTMKSKWSALLNTVNTIKIIFPIITKTALTYPYDIHQLNILAVSMQWDAAKNDPNIIFDLEALLDTIAFSDGALIKENKIYFLREAFVSVHDTTLAACLIDALEKLQPNCFDTLLKKLFAHYNALHAPIKILVPSLDQPITKSDFLLIHAVLMNQPLDKIKALLQINLSMPAILFALVIADYMRRPDIEDELFKYTDNITLAELADKKDFDASAYTILLKRMLEKEYQGDSVALLNEVERVLAHSLTARSNKYLQNALADVIKPEHMTCIFEKTHIQCLKFLLLKDHQKKKCVMIALHTAYERDQEKLLGNVEYIIIEGQMDLYEGFNLIAILRDKITIEDDLSNIVKKRPVFLLLAIGSREWNNIFNFNKESILNEFTSRKIHSANTLMLFDSCSKLGTFNDLEAKQKIQKYIFEQTLNLDCTKSTTEELCKQLSTARGRQYQTFCLEKIKTLHEELLNIVDPNNEQAVRNKWNALKNTVKNIELIDPDIKAAFPQYPYDTCESILHPELPGAFPPRFS